MSNNIEIDLKEILKDGFEMMFKMNVNEIQINLASGGEFYYSFCEFNSTDLFTYEIEIDRGMLKNYKYDLENEHGIESDIEDEIDEDKLEDLINHYKTAILNQIEEEKVNDSTFAEKCMNLIKRFEKKLISDKKWDEVPFGH